MSTQNEIVSSIIEFIDSDSTNEKEFNDLSIQIFAYQYENNIPFRQFAVQQGTSPRTAKTWRDIPPVPINAFKSLFLSCCEPSSLGRTFMTSGTTQDGIKGKSYHPLLDVYDASMKKNFKERFLGDLDDLEKIKMGILFPDESSMPNSSLAHYLSLSIKQFGTHCSRYYLDSHGINFEQLFEDLECAQNTRTAFALLGASFSIVHLLDKMEQENQRFNLPAGSRILDTGGFKGQSREIEQDDFYNQLSTAFGIPRSCCVNMYGMTELSTQFYDDGNETCPAIKTGPHWIKSRVVDPLTRKDVPKGKPGVLVHCDLAHFNIVSTILTEDAGIEVNDGFILSGRVDGENAKGCSMAVDEFLRATK